MSAYSNGPAGFGTLEHFNREAGRWYGLMQRTALQFVGGAPPSPGELAQAWRETLEGEGQTPFLGMFRDAWPEAWQEAGLQELRRWLQTPTFGLAREHQARWQALALAQQEYQGRFTAYETLLKEAMQRAFELFERRLGGLQADRAQAGHLRALFDLWIDAAEEAYAEIALSPRFRSVYGALIDAQMQLQAGIQREVEQACARFGIPTRTEVDAAHRRIHELERALRRAGGARSAGPGEEDAGSGPKAPPKAPPKRAAAGARRKSR